ncbi:MAG: ChaN family lipoprotein, partial [Kangiellaceae bacterium]|nr:ChaN family lipoprotein [Kangiellaceae bacterium]
MNYLKEILILMLLTTAGLLSGCVSTPVQNTITSYTTLYDYKIVKSQDQSLISILALAKNIKQSPIVFIGEFHSHQASHKFQLDLIQALHANNKDLVISMEQFSRDSQEVVDKYLNKEYGEETLIEEGNAWEHYKGSYRAILEFAKDHGIPIIAANAPNMFVRCIGRRGADFLTQIPEAKKAWSAQVLDLENKQYQKKFFSFLESAGTKHGQTKKEASKRQMNTYSAQLLRDTTMAESILAARTAYPNHQIVHLNGSFHSDDHLGTVAVLENQDPTMSATVISPVMMESLDINQLNTDLLKQGEYLYLLRSLPPRYLDEEKEMASITKL